MPKPPSSSATPRPVELLARLTTLSQELAGAFRPATVVEVVARTLEELLKPDRLSFVLLDAQTNQLAVTHDTSAVPVRTDDPLLQLALRRGPLAFGRNVKEEARRRGAALTDEPPGSWIGVPLVAAALAEPAATQAEIRAGERTLSFTAIAMAEPGSAVLVIEDQTERRRLQEQLIQSEKMSAIGQLIAGVAHDLNNPLASVVGFSDFLAEVGDIPPQFAEPLQVIRQEAERAATIVKNLLSFARSQEGERKLQPIGPIIESTLALLRNQLMANKVEATLEVDHGLPDVEVNGNQIKQVFVNLINNANQAIASDAPSGRIWVTAKRLREGVAVSITDSGPGMTEELAGHVFEPFFTTKGEGEGTGLGLSICQGIVKEHGGRITLDTKPGGGATFTVELPGGARAPLAEPAPAPVAAGKRLRILVVDDEPHILYYMRATLESWGHAVEVASDGAYALERAIAGDFDVIICDLRMPHLSGREMYQKLARHDPRAAERIIFATGDTVRGDTLQFLETLGRPYLHKPFTLAELRAAPHGVARGED